MYAAVSALAAMQPNAIVEAHAIPNAIVKVHVLNYTSVNGRV